MANVMTEDELKQAIGAALGGYAGAVSASPDLLDFAIKEAASKVWSLIKGLKENYFVGYSQSVTTTADDYFPVLSTTVREYNLPPDFAEMRYIEVLTSGYEYVRFVYRPMHHVDFQDARRGATQQSSFYSADTYWYDIVGKRTMVLAQYPEANMTLRIWYVKELAPILTNGDLSDVFYPFALKMASYAARWILLTLQDIPMSEAWYKQWTNDVQEIAAEASARQSADAEFVQDFPDAAG